MIEQEGSPAEPRRRRSAPPPTAERGEARWEVRRNRKPWQRFLERFGFTLIAVGVAIMVGLMVARLG